MFRKRPKPAALDAETTTGRERRPAATVLLVEADSNLRAMMSIVLRVDGHQVLEFRHGSDLATAFEEVTATEWTRSACILVMDVRRSELEGLKVVQRLRARGINLPLVVITAFPGAGVLAAAADLAALAVLEKPFDFEELRALVRAHVEPRI